MRVFEGSKGEREARLRGCEVVLSSEFSLLLVPRSSVLKLSASVEPQQNQEKLQFRNRNAKIVLSSIFLANVAKTPTYPF